MIGLGWHLARRQVRGAPDALLAVAVVLTTLLLLGAVAVRQGFSERAERAAVREGAAWQGSEPPPWEVAAPFTAGDRSLTLLAMWADRARPPVLPGLPRNPAPGEVFISPALAQALRSGADAPLLAARTPGRIAGVLGEELLLGPDELVAVAGFARSAAAPLAEHATRGESPGAPDLPLALVTLLLLVPAAALLVVCAGFDARRRERRLATLRLIGAGPRQVRVLAVVEAMVRSVPAAVVALVAGFLLRPLVASVPLGVRFFAADLRPGALAVTAVLLAAPLLAALATLGALRQVTVTPFAVQRRAGRPAPSWRRCLPLLAGCALYLLGTGLSRRIAEPLLAAFEVAGLVAVLVGLPLPVRS